MITQRSRFYSFLKSRPGLILAKTTALRVLIHATGLTPPRCPIELARTDTHT